MVEACAILLLTVIVYAFYTERLESAVIALLTSYITHVTLIPTPNTDE